MGSATGPGCGYNSPAKSCSGKSCQKDQVGCCASQSSMQVIGGELGE